MKNMLNDIYNNLDISIETGLATSDNENSLSTYQRLFYSQVKEKIGVDSVYFLRDEDGIAKIPLIYFSMMDTPDDNAAAKLHRLSWNMGEAPLLFVVTPTELKIYNNYKSPCNRDGSLDPDAGIIQTISLVADLETQRQELRPYNRSLLESGEYWRRCRERFNINTRVDTTLMNNLKAMRKKLINTIKGRLSECDQREIDVGAIVHGLLSRSILIKYLEERKDSNGESVFPVGFYAQYSTEGRICQQYTDILNDKESTYTLFADLEDKFNGDMLPLIKNEYSIVTVEDLKLLRLFLIGDLDFESQQLVMWPLYDFNIIPIQAISSIYELFFHLSDSEDDDKGTYYTPLHLVDTLLDEVYPWEGSYEPISVIDPSCGSGIFLVEIYRRIVCRWMQSNSTSKIDAQKLTDLLNSSIYGVDINMEAVRVASFSLSLALCDFLDPRSIWDELLFPKLVNTNLVECDFFTESAIFNDKKFDIVIGNPPWQSQLTKDALSYLNRCKKVVGDNQIAQAFSLKSADVCKENGTICLLMPSKPFLFNRSDRNIKYRTDFFENNDVSVIINFSIYRKFLFDHASAPAVAVIYSPRKPTINHIIYYCTPKPQFTMQDSKQFSIEPTDICPIPLDIARDDRIWKIAMWGSPRDLELINRWQYTYSTMANYIETNQMSSAEGFKRGNRTKECMDFLDSPVVQAKSLTPFYISINNLNRIDYTDFECLVSKKREVFKAPHLVIKQSHKKSRFISAVLDFDAVFNHSLLGVHGDLKKLKYLCLIINSKVFSYYHLLTNRKWLVERDELEAGDIWATPIPHADSAVLEEASSIFDELVSGMKSEHKYDAFISKIYHMKEYEKELVKDAIDYIYNYYEKKGKALSFKPPTDNTYLRYFETLREVLENTYGKAVICGGDHFKGDTPLSVLVLTLEGAYSEKLKIHTDTLQTQNLLLDLDTKLTETRNNIFIRRNVRVYSKDAIYIAKPAQQKYWNYTAACRDADEIFTDIMKSWRCNNE